MENEYTSDTSTDLDEMVDENEDKVDIFVDSMPSPLTEVSVIHSINEKPYYYLLETNPPKNLVSTFNIESDEIIEYSLFLYVLANNKMYPYVLCLLEFDKQYNMYHFPKIQYKPYTIKTKSIVQNENENENENGEKDADSDKDSISSASIPDSPEEVHKIEINNLCFSQIAEIFSIDEESLMNSDSFDPDNTDFIMKNTFQYKSNHYITIRADNYLQYLDLKPQKVNTLSGWFFSQPSKEKYVWCTVEDLKRDSTLRGGHRIHPDVLDLFHDAQNKPFSTIVNEEQKEVENPRTMYPCKWESKTNEFLSIDLSKEQFKISQHPKHGFLYFFSDEPLAKNNNTLQYIVFDGRLPYIETKSKSSGETSTDDTDADADDSNPVYTSIRFSYKNTTIQGVLSQDYFYQL